MLWPLERAAEVLRWYREFIADAPEELNGFFAFLRCRPRRPSRRSCTCRRCAASSGATRLDPEQADEPLAPGRALEPALDGVQPMPFPAASRLRRPLPARRPVVLARRLRRGDPRRGDRSATSSTARSCRRCSRPCTSIRSTGRRSAWPERHGLGLPGRELGAGHRRRRSGPARTRTRSSAWSVDYWEALHPYSAGGAYVNLMMEEGEERVKATYGDELRPAGGGQGQYDPDNFFRVNQNIQPG